MTRLPAILATPARRLDAQADKELAMTTTSARRAGVIRAALLAGTFAIAAQAWSPTSIADGFSPTGEPDSPYFRGDVTPPSWQGRPIVIPENGGLALPELSRHEAL